MEVKKAAMRKTKAQRKNDSMLAMMVELGRRHPQLDVRIDSVNGVTVVTLETPPVKPVSGMPALPLKQLRADSDGGVGAWYGTGGVFRDLGNLRDLETNLEGLIDAFAQPTTACQGCGDAAVARFNVRICMCVCVYVYFVRQCLFRCCGDNISPSSPLMHHDGRRTRLASSG